MNVFRNLTLGLILLLFTASAAAVTWSPTDVAVANGDVNTINLSTEGAGMFGILAPGSMPPAGGFADLAIAAVDKITFTVPREGITNLAGDTFNLGASFQFNLAYVDGGNWPEETAIFELTPGSSRRAGGISLQVVHVMPIPVPPALVLFASALLALVALRRTGQVIV